MRDDLNTPEAIAASSSPAGRGRISTRPEAVSSSSLSEALLEVLTIFGSTSLRSSPPTSTGARPVLRRAGERSAPGRRQGACAAREGLAGCRQAARELANEGWAVEDTPEGPILSRR